MYRYFLFLGLFWATFSVRAQVDQDQLNVAKHYFQKEEYEKAAAVYEKLYKKNTESEFIYNSYLSTLLKLEDFKEAEKLTKSRIKSYPEQLDLLVDLGYIYEEEGSERKAEKRYQQAIENLPANAAKIELLATAFELRDKYQYTIQTYQKGNKIIQGRDPFNYKIGQLYAKQGETKKMINTFLDVFLESTERKQEIKNIWQDELVTAKDRKLLQSRLLERIQNYPDHTIYNELLIWLYVQEKKFSAALTQAKALDRRLNKKGQRVMDFAEVARKSGAFTVAIDAYEYVIDQGNGYLQLKARMDRLDTKRAKITNISNYTQEDLLDLRDDYKAFLNKYGRNSNTASTMQELARLEAFYLDQTDKAVQILEEVKDMPRADERLKAECKIILGDIYLVNGKVWDAVLMYSQVDKAHKDEPIGDEAKFKNAKLYYYIGDFEWSQTQLDVLKGSTSKLIANDALELSTFITDNLGLDTIKVPLRMYAQAEMFIFQHKYEQALALLDSIKARYPGHKLTDDIYFKQADIRTKKGQYQKAAKLLEQVIDLKPDDILADDALFKLAQLYDNELNDSERAKELYQKIVLDYTDSIYAVHARKRYRALRGDSLN